MSGHQDYAFTGFRREDCVKVFRDINYQIENKVIGKTGLISTLGGVGWKMLTSSESREQYKELFGKLMALISMI